MASAEDEPITVHPRGLIGIEDHRMAVQHRAELSASERQSKVATGALVNGVHGQAARFIGCTSKIGGRYGVRHIRRVDLGYTWRAAHFKDNRVAPGCALTLHAAYRVRRSAHVSTLQPAASVTGCMQVDDHDARSLMIDWIPLPRTMASRPPLRQLGAGGGR